MSQLWTHRKVYFNMKKKKKQKSKNLILCWHCVGFIRTSERKQFEKTDRFASVSFIEGHKPQDGEIDSDNSHRSYTLHRESGNTIYPKTLKLRLLVV